MGDQQKRVHARPLTRSRFLGSLYITELVLAVLSLGIARFTLSSFFPYGFMLTAEKLLLGLLLAIPLMLIVLMASTGPVSKIGLIKRAMDNITGRLKQVLGSSLLSLTAMDIVLLSTAAGFAEELFFRGLLQSHLGAIGAAIIFGLLHALTPAYFVMATAIGLYFGYLYEVTGNLLIPMVSHAAYDIFALTLLRLQFARQNVQ